MNSRTGGHSPGASGNTSGTSINNDSSVDRSFMLRQIFTQALKSGTVDQLAKLASMDPAIQEVYDEVTKSYPKEPDHKNDTADSEEWPRQPVFRQSLTDQQKNIIEQALSKLQQSRNNVQISPSKNRGPNTVHGMPPQYNNKKSSLIGPGGYAVRQSGPHSQVGLPVQTHLVQQAGVGAGEPSMPGAQQHMPASLVQQPNVGNRWASRGPGIGGNTMSPVVHHGMPKKENVATARCQQGSQQGVTGNMHQGQQVQHVHQPVLTLTNAAGSQVVQTRFQQNRVQSPQYQQHFPGHMHQQAQPTTFAMTNPTSQQNIQTHRGIVQQGGRTAGAMQTMGQGAISARNGPVFQTIPRMTYGSKGLSSVETSHGQSQGRGRTQTAGQAGRGGATPGGRGGGKQSGKGRARSTSDQQTQAIVKQSFQQIKQQHEEAQRLANTGGQGLSNAMPAGSHGHTVARLQVGSQVNANVNPGQQLVQKQHLSIIHTPPQSSNSVGFHQHQTVNMAPVQPQHNLLTQQTLQSQRAQGSQGALLGQNIPRPISSLPQTFHSQSPFQPAQLRAGSSNQQMYQTNPLSQAGLVPQTIAQQVSTNGLIPGQLPMVAAHTLLHANPQNVVQPPPQAAPASYPSPGSMAAGPAHMMPLDKPNDVVAVTTSGQATSQMDQLFKGQNYEKGREYLIHYSNGNRVVGIWDGQFFKLRALDSQSSMGSQALATVPAADKTKPTLSQSTPEVPATGLTTSQYPVTMAATPTTITTALMVTTASAINALTRPPLHEAINSVEPKPKPRPPRQREEGKLALCKNCGTVSMDYDNCDSCKRSLPHDAPLIEVQNQVTGSIKKQSASTRTETKPNHTSPCIATTAVSAPTAAAVTSTATSSSQTTVPTPRGGGKRNQRPGRKNRGAKAGVPSVSEPIETVEILSSSDDENSQANGDRVNSNITSQATQTKPTQSKRRKIDESSPTLSVAAPHGLAPLSPEPSEGVCGKVLSSVSGAEAHPTKAEQPTEMSEDELRALVVQLHPRSVRIGSLRAAPADEFRVNVAGIQFTIRCNTDCLQVNIGGNEITKVLGHFNDQMPCMFMSTSPGCAQRLREALHMHPGGEPYYDPTSKVEAHKYLTVIFDGMGVDNYLRGIFHLIQKTNPFFKQHTKLLDEIEYDEANQILIKCTPHAHMQLLQFGFDEDDDEDGTNERSRSPSPVRVFNGQIVRLFVYPPQPATGGISVNNEDLFCLNDGEFLNDVIIDFYLKYIFLDILTAGQREKTHIFSSFFYRRLTQKHGRMPEDLKLTIQQRRHSRVRTWTRHSDLFSKDFIIVPINESAHWYLAIICFPGLREPTNALVKKEPASKPAEASSQPPSTDNDSASVSASQEPMDQTTPAETQNDKPGPDHPEADQPDPEASNSSTDSEVTFKKRPCILIFDSLAGPSRKGVVRILREYLQVEWDVRRKEKEGERVFNVDTFPGDNLLVPQQLNYSDCGIYVLQYTESFFKTPPACFTIPMPPMEDWFNEEVALSKREQLQQLILSLKTKLNPDLEYDPEADGCILESSSPSQHHTFISHHPMITGPSPQGSVNFHGRSRSEESGQFAALFDSEVKQKCIYKYQTVFSM